jgi:hypothetical protein
MPWRRDEEPFDSVASPLTSVRLVRWRPAIMRSVSEIRRSITTRLRRWSALHAAPFHGTPVIVYQMAKVGSTAVVDCLKRARLPVFHVHRMDADHLQRLRGRRAALGWDVGSLPAYDRLGLRLHEKVIEAGRPAKIVTLVRDPIARNLSSYFEHFADIWGLPDARGVVSMDDVYRGFLERYPHDESLTWFDEELQRVTGLNVYDHPFPATGHLQLQSGRLDLLILRSDLPNETKRLALSNFLGTNLPPFGEANRTADKSHGETYEQFRRSLRLPPEYVERMLSSRYCRHFYSDEEREALRQMYC